MMFEHRSERLLPMREFLARLAGFFAASAAVIGTSLGLGTVGYHHFCRLPWVDSLLNASMILSGMGPVDHIDSDTGKLFAAGYALYSGIAFISTAGLLVAPVAHRMLHSLHLEQEMRERDQSS
jgi:hypothetical protein